MCREVPRLGAARWGEDERDACMLHEHAYSLFQRHVLGTTAAQFVWEPLENEPAGEAPVQQAASSSTTAAAERHLPTKGREFPGKHQHQTGVKDKNEKLVHNVY